MATDQRDSSRAEWRAAVSRPIDAQAFQPVSASIGLEVAGVSVSGKAQLQNTEVLKSSIVDHALAEGVTGIVDASFGSA